MVLAIGVPATTPVFLGGLGFTFVDLGSAQILGWPSVGTDVRVSIPSGTPLGTILHVQAAAGTNTWGNLSSPEDVRVR